MEIASKFQAEGLRVDPARCFFNLFLKEGLRAVAWVKRINLRQKRRASGPSLFIFG